MPSLVKFPTSFNDLCWTSGANDVRDLDMTDEPNERIPWGKEKETGKRTTGGP